MKKIYLIINSVFSIFLILAACTVGKPESVPVGKEIAEEAKGAQIVTEVDVKKTAEGKFRFQITVHNQLEQPVTFVFPSAKKYELFVVDSAGRVVYDAQAGKVFAQVIERLQVESGKKVTWVEEWHVDDIAPGTYTVRVQLTPSSVEPIAVNKKKLTAEQTFRVDVR